VIRLKDNSPGFDDPNKPKIVLSVYQGQGTGDVMHSYVRNLTVDVGRGNPGAVGLFRSTAVWSRRDFTEIQLSASK
jgi:non-canonical (house-cleaning) NTP pyrophosphatase